MRNIGKKIRSCNVLVRKFSAQRTAEHPFGLPARAFEAKNIHEFGYGGLGGHVVSREDAAALELQAGFVELHGDPAAVALRDVEHDDAAADGLLQGMDEPFGGGGVSCAVSFEDHGAQSGCGEHGAEHRLIEAREELDDLDAAGQAGGDAQLAGILRGAEDRREVVGDIDADLGQRGVVLRAEGVEGLGAAFRGAVGAEKAVLEVERHLGDQRSAVAAGSGDLDGRDEVLAAVGAQHADGDLASGEDHGLGEVLEHEAHGRGGVGHRVGAVQDDKAVVTGVVVADDPGELDPVCRGDVRRVDDGREGPHVDIDVEALERGEFVVDAAEVEGHQRAGRGIGLHADRAAGVDNQDGGTHKVLYLLGSCGFLVVCQSSRASTRKLTGRNPSLQETIAEAGFFIQPS